MKKFLIALSLFGLAHFTLAGESDKNFAEKFEFDIDEYANKPCGEDWSEFEKKMCNMDRNSYLQMTQADTKKWYGVIKPCIENLGKPECEKHKISWAKHRKIAMQIALECKEGNADSCYEAGRSFITEIHDPRNDKLATISFNFGCNLKSAKNCEQLGLMLFYTDKNKADELLTKACEMDKNHCDGIALTTKKLDLAKQMCDNGNAFACGNYMNLMDKDHASFNEVARAVNTFQKFCGSDIDTKFEHLRAAFVSNKKFEEFKNVYKNGCKD